MPVAELATISLSQTLFKSNQMFNMVQVGRIARESISTYTVIYIPSGPRVCKSVGIYIT